MSLVRRAGVDGFPSPVFTCLVCHEGHGPGKGPVVDMADHEPEEQGDAALSVQHQEQGLFRQEHISVELWDEPPKAMAQENEEHSNVSGGCRPCISIGDRRTVLDLGPCGVTF